MVLQIRTTGVEDYMDGGGANIKALIIGGPGAGKTRMSSFWPRPIYADCENGRASIADRSMPYAEIHSSKDMFDFLAYLRALERVPKAERQYQTVVIDTLDSFARKVKDEWLLSNPNASAFRGFEAWGYLDTRMGMLMTRLLNLDYNVLVLSHYKEKTVVEGKGEDKVESREFTLQLQGDIKDTAFNDFDLVGWLGTYWSPVDGERVEKRGLTFKATPDKPFLKDRFHVTPKWMEVNFNDGDYGNLFQAWLTRLDSLPESQDLDLIPDADLRQPMPATVVGPLEGGPVAPADPKEIPLDGATKPELMAIVSAERVPGVKGNSLKGEIISAIRAHREAQAAKPEPASEPAPEQAVPAAVVTDPSTPVHDPDGTEESPADVPMALDPALLAAPTVEDVAAALGGEVISETPSVDTPTPAPAPEPSPAAAPAQTCADCGLDLAGEDANYVRLSFIKFRRYLCGTHYQTAKKETEKR